MNGSTVFTSGTRTTRTSHIASPPQIQIPNVEQKQRRMKRYIFNQNNYIDICWHQHLNQLAITTSLVSRSPNGTQWERGGGGCDGRPSTSWHDLERDESSDIRSPVHSRAIPVPWPSWTFSVPNIPPLSTTTTKTRQMRARLFIVNITERPIVGGTLWDSRLPPIPPHEQLWPAPWNTDNWFTYSSGMFLVHPSLQVL
jgi:hypothetical protein